MNTLDLILDAVAQYGLPMVMLAILIMWLKPKADEVWRKAMGIKIKENETVQNLLQADFEVKALLQECQAAFQAHWCTLWQFHNGSYSMAGVPFLRLSATHEVTDNQHAPVAHQFQGLATSLFSDNTMLMYKHPVVCLDIDDLTINSAVRNSMISNGFCHAYMAGIKDTRGRLIGSLTISYADHRELTQEEYTMIERYADRCGLLLELVARTGGKDLSKFSEGR